MKTYRITDHEGNAIGLQVYSEAKYAVPGAKRASVARSRNAQTLTDGLVYIVENDGSIYDRQVALVRPNSVTYL